MRMLATAVVFLALAGLAAAADDAKDAAKKLEGTYEVIDIIIAGRPDPKKKDLKSVVIKDGEIIVQAKRDEPAKFTIDPSKKPAHFDISPNNTTTTMPGIYEVKETDKGTELTIAFGGGPDAERPKDFKAGPKDVVLKLLRKKAK